jgi:DNA-binding CsgD family transcriptional regulator
MIEDTRLVRNSEFASWKRNAKCADVGFVVLSRSQRETDLMTLQFGSTPKEDWCEQKQWFASSLARTFEMRRPGLITEALSFESLQMHDAYTSDIPILGAENVLGLTRTEFQVCVLVSRGLAAKSIAAELGVSTTTVRTHLRNIYTKTGFTGFHQLAKRLISAEEQRAFHEPLRMSA